MREGEIVSAKLKVLEKLRLLQWAVGVRWWCSLL